MLETLSEKLQGAFKTLRGQGHLTEDNIKDGLKEIRLALLEADVNFAVVKQLIGNVRQKALGRKVLSSLSPAKQVLKIVRDELVEILGNKQERLRRSSRPPSVYLVVGLQGSGKTTSTGKLALWLSKQGRKPLLVSVDVHRPAAREQLAIVAGQIGQPVYKGREGETTPLQLASGALREARQIGRETVLVDTAGRLHLDDELMAELVEIKRDLSPVEILFVADAMTGQDAVKSAAEFHRRLDVSGVILTKMDGDARGGAALSIRQVTGCPIKFLGTGEKPKALEVFHPDRIVSRLLGMGDMLTFIEKVEEQIDDKQAAKIEKRIRANQFTLDDFRKQLGQVKKMGSLKSLIDMLPASGPFQQMRNTEIDPRQLARTEAMINSMTPQERANAEILNGSRKRRIAAGSGTTVQQLNAMLKNYRQAQSVMRGMVAGSAPAGQAPHRRRKRSKRKRRKRRGRVRRRRSRPVGPASLLAGGRLAR